MDASQPLAVVLASFGDSTAPEVALARRLAATDNATITRSHDPITCPRLESLYALRASNPALAPARARQCAALSAAAGRYPDEAWDFYMVKSGGEQVTVYANAEGVGRFVMDLSSTASSA